MRHLIYSFLFISSLARADVSSNGISQKYDLENIIRVTGSSIADSMASGRLKIQYAKAQDLREKLKAFNVAPKTHLTLQFITRTTELLNGMEEARDAILGIEFGFLERGYSRIIDLMTERAASEKFGDPDALADLNLRIEMQIKSLQELSLTIASYIAKEKFRLTGLRRSEDSVATFYDRQIKDLENAAATFDRLAPLLARESIGTDVGHSGQILLNRINLFGYRSAFNDRATP